MNMPEPPAKASRRELRKTLLRMRLEMHRQELRHESLLLMATVGIRRGHWRRWLRIALIAFPLLRRNPPRHADKTANATKDSRTED